MAKYLKGDETVAEVLDLAGKLVKEKKVKKAIDFVEFNKYLADKREPVRVDIVDGILSIVIRGLMDQPRDED